jgi:hypothetical protein
LAAEALRTLAAFVRISDASLRDDGVHDVTIHGASRTIRLGCHNACASVDPRG